MNKTIQTTNIFNYTMEAWEKAFAQLNQSEVGSKEYNQAVKIMMAIDKDLTTKLIANDTPEQSETTITVYHGTHQHNLTFTNNRTITNYNHIGTWFTSSKTNAERLYGKNVIEAQVTLNNPLIINYTDVSDFDNLFIIEDLMKQYNVTVEGEKVKGKLVNCIWTNGKYIQAVQQHYINQGYDSIIFENSTIDCYKEDTNHDVYIVLDAQNIISYAMLSQVA